MKRSRKRIALAQLLLLAVSVFAVASIGRFAGASPAAVDNHGHGNHAGKSHHELAQVRRATAASMTSTRQSRRGTSSAG